MHPTKSRSWAIRTTTTRLTAFALVVLTLASCGEHLLSGPASPSGQGITQNRTGSADVDAILAALSDTARSDGTLIVTLQSRDAKTGAAVLGQQLPIQARRSAEHTIRLAFPQLTERAPVEYTAEIVENGRATPRTFFRTFIRVSGALTRDVVAALMSHPNVAYVSPNWTNVEKRGDVGVTMMVTTDARSWAIDSMRADDAWALGWRGAGVSLRLVDTGIDGTQAGHPDVLSDSGTMVYNATWGVHADDRCTTAFSNCWYEAPFHGTGVFGIGAAVENNAAAVGIAPAPSPWLAVGKATYVTTAGALAGSEQDISDAVNQVTAYHPSGRRVGVTSIGFATEDTTAHRALRQAFADSYNAGVLWFSAVTENTAGMVGLPGIFPEVIAVGYLNEDLSLRANSPIHPKIEFVAPGANITTSWNREDFPSGVIFGQNGSSYAAPAAAGVARLGWEANPTWTPATLRTRMQSSARDLGYPGRDELYGYGMPDAICLIQQQSPCDALSVVGYIDGPSIIDAAGPETWTAVMVSGGTGAYTYRWEYKQGTSAWTLVGTGASYTRNITTSNPSFSLRLTVTSGTRSTVNTKSVSVRISTTCGSGKAC